LRINNERQDCKTSTMWRKVLVGEGRMKAGDEGEGTWLMGFTYICEIERWNL
jgi:hypothetical protein